MIVLLCLFAVIHLGASSSAGVGCTNQFQVIKNCGTSSTCATTSGNEYSFKPVGICNKQGATVSMVYSCSADGSILTAVVYQSSSDCTGSFVTINYDITNGADDGLTSQYLTCACTSSPYWTRKRFWSDVNCSTAAGISDGWYLSTTPEQVTSPGCQLIYPGTCDSNGTISKVSYEYSDTICPMNTTASGYVHYIDSATLGCEGADNIGSAYQVLSVMPQDSSACPSGSSCPSTDICGSSINNDGDDDLTSVGGIGGLIGIVVGILVAIGFIVIMFVHASKVRSQVNQVEKITQTSAELTDLAG